MARTGLLLTPQGERVEVPEHLLDEESITFPFGKPLKEPGRPTAILKPDQFYKRHELIPGDAYLFLSDNVPLTSINEAAIRAMLGPRAGRRPNRLEVVPRYLPYILQGLRNGTIPNHAGYTLVIPEAMWNEADQQLRALFTNHAQQQRIPFVIENVGIGGASWEYRQK